MAVLQKEIVRLTTEVEQLKTSSSEQNMARLEATVAAENIKRLENEVAKLKVQSEEQVRVHQLNLQNELTLLKAQLTAESENEIRSLQQQLEEQRSKNNVSLFL